MVFQPGTLILYGGTGVCRVDGIGPAPAAPAAASTLYYRLKPLYQSGEIYVPVESNKVFMRPILSRAEAEALIRQLPQLQGDDFWALSKKDLAGRYEAVLKSHDCRQLASLTGWLHSRAQALQAQKKHLGSLEESCRRRAEELLFTELAAALELPREQVPSYIADTLNTGPT